MGMSRVDTDQESDSHQLISSGPVASITNPRDVPLGGIRAMNVRRTLPNRGRTTIGAWCFLDHYGPDPQKGSAGMQVAPHPHTGLQTVSWLFSGNIEHRDSTGVTALVSPGSVNLMTAGRGIQHSEVSTQDSASLHGVQLWIALPDHARHQKAHFDAALATLHHVDEGTVLLFIGSLPGLGSIDVPTYSELVGAEIMIPSGGTMTLVLESRHEHAVLLDRGLLHVEGAALEAHQLAYIAPGVSSLRIHNPGDEQAVGILIGGEPFQEEIVMWWNFIGRTHDDIEQFRREWQAGITSGSARFGHLDHMPALNAPEMPRVTLRARANR